MVPIQHDQKGIQTRLAQTGWLRGVTRLVTVFTATTTTSSVAASASGLGAGWKGLHDGEVVYLGPFASG